MESKLSSGYWAAGYFTYEFGFQLEPKLRPLLGRYSESLRTCWLGIFFVFIYHDYTAKYLYEILDGKQRMQTLLDFYYGRFSYRGKCWDDLHPIDRNHITDYKIAYGEARSYGGKTIEPSREQKYNFFLKLNTGGKLQDPKHIKYVESLLKLDTNRNGIQALAKSIS